MKRYFWFFAVAALVLAGCDEGAGDGTGGGDNTDPTPGTVSITGDALDARLTINATELAQTTVSVDIEASRGIENLLVAITVDPANTPFGTMLAALGGEFDLANPTPELAGILAGLAAPPMGIVLPYGEDVKGETELNFDVTTFLPAIYGMAGECEVDFRLTVRDDLDGEDIQTIKLAFVNDIPGAVSIEGDGFDIDRMQNFLPTEVASASVVVDVASARGIDKFLVEITSSSPALTEMLSGAGLGDEFDLANPTAAQLAGLAAFEGALPYGDAVRGKTELPFDISALLPALYGVAQSNCAVFIKITVSDDEENSASETLMLDFGPQPELTNGGFEGWSPYVAWFGNIWCPSTTLTYDNIGMPIAEFWDTANVGISVVSANNITMYDETDKRPGTSGTRSVKMTSTVAFGKFASGNIYTGNFGEITTNPLGANVFFGRPFTARPSALKGWYKASPGSITHADSASGKEVGNPDEYQIYIMLTNWTEPRIVNTGDSSTLIDFTADYVIGIGQISDIGADTKLPVTQWTNFEIPIKYKSEATPTHIVVVATSCKYGDYLTGSTDSVLQIDDFELVY